MNLCELGWAIVPQPWRRRDRLLSRCKSPQRARRGSSAEPLSGLSPSQAALPAYIAFTDLVFPNPIRARRAFTALICSGPGRSSPCVFHGGACSGSVAEATDLLSKDLLREVAKCQKAIGHWEPWAETWAKCHSWAKMAWAVSSSIYISTIYIYTEYPPSGTCFVPYWQGFFVLSLVRIRRSMDNHGHVYIYINIYNWLHNYKK